MTLSGEILVGLIVFAFIGFFYLSEKRYLEEKKDLLNRIMAKDYKEFAYFEHAKQVVDKPLPAKTLFEEKDSFSVD